MILDLDFPVIVEKPSCDEVVVVGVEEVVAAPGLVREAICELGVLQNLRSICYRAARQTRQPAVDPVAGGAVKVPPHEVHGPEELPDAVAVDAA